MWLLTPPITPFFWEEYCIIFLELLFQTVRDIVWSMSNDELRTFVEKNQNKQIDGQFACDCLLEPKQISFVLL